MTERKFGSGLVVGKFYPPHLGHRKLIESAIAACDKVDVLVVDNPRYKIPAEQRARWLREEFPVVSVSVKTILDIQDDDNSENWARATIDLLGRAPDVVFTSEDYGVNYAKYLGCEHVLFDKARLAVPISATQLRLDLSRYWRYLVPAARADLAIRIVVVGAESTGTTTLSQALAKELRAPCVPEMGRFYTESMATFAARERGEWCEVVWCDEDFINIARLQQLYESLVAARSEGLVVCDTNVSATVLWQQRYLGRVSPELRAMADRDRVDLYVVTGDEIPFVQDGLRDGESIRHEMHQDFLRAVEASGVRFAVATGSLEQRVAEIMPLIERIVREKSVLDLADYSIPESR